MQIDTIVRLLRNPIITVQAKIRNVQEARFLRLCEPQVLEKLPDKKAIMVRYRMNFGKYPDLRHPKTYNEKLQWLKLYNRRPEYALMVDKYEVKKYVADIIGEEYVIPTYGVWDRAEDIDFDRLPDQFVLKCTHDSESVIICKDKSKFDIPVAKEKLNRCLTKSLYLWGREWPYKNVKPRIIAETYLEDTVCGELRDYKFFCFSGKVKMLFIASNRFNKELEGFDFFDEKGNHLDLTWCKGNASHCPDLPINFEKMKEMAVKLSDAMPHARIDFYECNGMIYFGEITLFPASGLAKMYPVKWDEIIGEWLELPAKKIK